MDAVDLERYIALYAEKRREFDEFAALLAEYNGKFNLTAIVENREVEVKHFLDSLAGEFLFPQGASAVEVGSGAGFPSVPLMLARRDLKFTLIESIGKKCEFLRLAAKTLQLNAEVCNLRAEDAGKDARYREKFDICCARAVARLNTLAEYCMPLVKRGGLFVAYKGEKDELEEAKTALKILGGGEVRTYRYSLPDGMGERTLIAVKKIKETPEKYPRGQGKERSKPL